MGLEELSGRVYGPLPHRTCAGEVAAFVEATSDDTGRWSGAAPPGYAAALLFVVAPHLLADPAIQPSARAVIHGEQTFVWHQALPVDARLDVEGIIGRVRTRGDVHLVGFELRAFRGDETVVEGSSTFLMSAGAPPAGSSAEEREPPPDDDGGPPDGWVSASRADLVRYAAATRDWNPIHWDHDAAFAAGLPGVVVHGLLQSAWLCRWVAGRVSGDRPLASARFRYRAPLRPAVPARIEGDAGEDGGFRLALRTGAGVCVSGVVEPGQGVTR